MSDIIGSMADLRMNKIIGWQCLQAGSEYAPGEP
jgi:hypothetical protein